MEGQTPCIIPYRWIHPRDQDWEAIIKFKKTSPKSLQVKGPISGLVIQALREISKDKAIPGQLNKISELLRKEESANVKHDALLAAV